MLFFYESSAFHYLKYSSLSTFEEIREYRRINGIHPSQLLRKLGNKGAQTMLNLLNSTVLIQLNTY